MDVGSSPLPDSINPNNFPAKLWRLVNSRTNRAIFWDSQGDTIIINRPLFEKQILSPGSSTLDNADAFKTTNYSSFVRQLNLYGFRKIDPADKDGAKSKGDSEPYDHFSNPSFKRNHPELVATLRRLTANNKAKLQAGLSVSCRPASRFQRFGGRDGVRAINLKRAGSSSLLSLAHGEPDGPYYLSKTPATLTESHRSAGVSSSSNAVALQQAFFDNANLGNPNCVTFTPRNAQHQPSYCRPVFQCYQNSVASSHLTGSGLFSPHSFYQVGELARYPVNMMCCIDHSQDPQHMDYQEVKRCDINLDTVFQIADEILQTPPSSCLVTVVTPEKPGPVLVSSSITFNTMLSDPLHAGAETDIADIVTYKQQEDSVLSVPEQMPDDAIIEVTIDDGQYHDVKSKEVSTTAASC